MVNVLTRAADVADVANSSRKCAPLKAKLDGTGIGIGTLTHSQLGI